MGNEEEGKFQDRGTGGENALPRFFTRKKGKGGMPPTWCPSQVSESRSKTPKGTHPRRKLHEPRAIPLKPRGGNLSAADSPHRRRSPEESLPCRGHDGLDPFKDVNDQTNSDPLADALTPDQGSGGGAGPTGGLMTKKMEEESSLCRGLAVSATKLPAPSRGG